MDPEVQSVKSVAKSFVSRAKSTSNVYRDAAAILKAQNAGKVPGMSESEWNMIV